jgi:hypothetical protein
MSDLNLGRPGLSVLPLGVGDAFSAIHHPTSMLVSRYQTPAWDNDLVLIDCPQSIRMMMREADDGRFHGLDLGRVNTLILTHLHADHAGGLETLAAFFKIALQRKLRLVALPEVIEGIDRFLHELGDFGKKEAFFDIVPIDEDHPVTIGLGDSSMYIEAKKTSHPIPTSALKIYRGEAPKKRVPPPQNEDGSFTLDLTRVPIIPHFAYSCDTSFDLELWDWLWKDHPSLVAHEVGHGPVHTNFEEMRSFMGRGFGQHVGAFVGGAAPERFQSLRLTHYPDDMFPMLEASAFQLFQQGKLELV